MNRLVAVLSAAVLSLACAGAALWELRRMRSPLYFRLKWELEWHLFTRCPDTDASRVGTREGDASFSRIAHAGGGVRGLAYTNSRQALDSSYALGFRAFEVDLNWTADDSLVLMHDWVAEASLLGLPPGPAKYETFQRARMAQGLTQMTLRDLAAWAAAHPDAWILTDVKGRNLEALRGIQAGHPGLADRLIPQVFRFREYAAARRLGFPRIILTLYVENYGDDAVIRFAGRCRPWAVTMPEVRARGALPGRLTALGIPGFAHTVNDSASAVDLERRGIRGVYTDWLPPGAGPT